MRVEALLAGLLLFAGPAWAQTRNYANPQYNLPGTDYKHESPAVNEMFRNIFTETNYLQQQITPLQQTVLTISSAVANSGSTVTVVSPLYGTGTSGNPIRLDQSALEVAAATTALRASILSTVGASTAAIALGLDVTAAPYSAVCDGTTDDSAALAACVAASSRDHPCLLPPRTCGTSSALTLTPGHFLTGWSASSSTLRFNVATGPCAAGSGGLVRLTSTSGGSSYRGLSFFTLQAHTKDPGCIANASAASGQVSNIEIDHVTFADVAGSTGTVGLFMGRNTTFDVHHNYFDTSLSRDIYDQGAFTNGVYFHHNFFDYLIASSTQNYQVDLGGQSGQVNGCTMTDSIFESGPNSLRINTGAGCTVANNYFSDVLAQPSSSTWVTINGGYGNQVGPLYMNSEGSNTEMTCVKVVGSHGTIISGVMCDSARIAFDLEGSSGTIVKGNTIFFPGTVGVKISSAMGSEIGVNDEQGNYSTGARWPVYCDGGANSNNIVTRYPNPGASNYTDTCSAANSVEVLTDRTLNGLNSINLGSSFTVGPSTDTTVNLKANGTAIMGRSSLAASSASGGTYQMIDKDTTTELVFATHNGFSGTNLGTKYWGNYVGTLAGMELFTNSNNNSPFRYASFGDVGIYNTRPSGFLGSVKLGLLGAFPLTINDGTVRIGTYAFTNWNQWGGFTMPAGSSATITSLYVTSATFTNTLNMGSNLINSVADPVSAQDAATKNYVDSNISGLDFRAPCRLGTTAALPSNSYNNGSSGVGATLTGLSIGALTIDGATANVNDRILVKNEASPARNGIYKVTQNSALVVYILTRATDMDQASEMPAGTAVFVTSGAVNSDGATDPSEWVTTADVATVGTDSVVFYETEGPGTVQGDAAVTVTRSSNVVNLSLNSSSVTLQGNTFNGPSQLVKTDANTGLSLTSAAFSAQLSVGGSTFTVVGGSATVAYLLTAGSIKANNIASGTQCLHADSSGNISGTGSDCSASTGAGLTSTQTFSGANTFYTVRPSSGIYGVYVATLTVTLSAVATYDLSLSSGTDYMLEWDVMQNTSAGQIYLQFNGDTGANYNYVIRRFSAAGSASSSQSTAGTSCALVTSDTISAGQGGSGTVFFGTRPGNVATRRARIHSEYSTTAIEVEATGACQHNGSGNLTRATIGTTAGTMSGYLYLHHRVKP
jgi:hypothetical protein